MDAWLTVEPQQRATGLDRWATPALARSLKLTDPHAIPATRRDTERTVATVEASEYQGRYEVFLADETSVLVDVVGDGADGWIAHAISPKEG